MNLLKFVVQRKILIGLMTVLVLFIGGFSILKLDKELFPALEFDGAYIEINAGEMPAIEVERTITNPLEKQIRSIEGVEETTSTTTIGRSDLQVTFERGRGDELFKEVESVINQLTPSMSGVKDVVAGQIGTSQSYEFYMDISEGSMEEMTAFAKDVLEPRLEDLKEVRDVSLVGIQEHEVSIEFNRDKIADKGLDVSQIITILQGANSESTLGEISEGKNSSSLRWNTKLENIDDVKNLQIPAETGFISLKDVAEVSVKPVENSSFVWKNGTKDFIFVQVGRVSDVTQIEMAEAIRAEVENIRDDGEIKGFELNEMVAQADYVKDSIDGVTSNILIGGAIAVAILLIFLRNVRATLIIGLSIPTSVLLTFASMWAFNYSLNMITLIGLGLGIGMMVDSSIVILESIYRKKEQGLRKFDAVVTGTKEVASAVIASMLTTIVVFLPIGLLGGEMGQFMIMLSVVVAITLISSVLIAFTLIPSLSEKFLKLSASKEKKQDGIFKRGYGNLIGTIVKKKRNSIAVITLFIIMLAGSFLLVTKIPMTIMPDVFNRYAEIMINVETGLSIEEENQLVEKINETLSKIEDVETNYLMDNGSMYYAIINMTKGDDITREQKEVNEEIFSSLRDLEKNYPVEGVQSAMSGGGGYPVQVNISGENFDELQSISNEFMNKLDGIEGIVGINNSIERTSSEQVIELDEQALEDAGISSLHLKQKLEQEFLHMPVGEMTIENEGMPLMVQWDEALENREMLLNLKIPSVNGEKELSNFIELKTVETPNEIKHVDGERFISVSADIEGKDLGTINREVQNIIEDFDMPNGYQLSVAGDLEEQQELMMEMILILGIAIFLVYFVMAVQFNHLTQPLIVMSVIPMTIVGVILGLFLTQRELSVMSAMGIVMLIGIVLNNAILLIDRTNQLRKEGYSVEDALVEAGKNRIRPIFMTTLTTVGGMLPLALASGTSGNYQAPMATVIISGLTFSTLITLVLIPAVYRLFGAIGIRKGKIKNNKITKEEKVSEAAS
jgi:multidrug efflux pump subunit AcrB